MADRRRTHPRDAGDGWFVDTTCIDCDVARLLAPGLIHEDAGGGSYFGRPPQGPQEEAMAWRALLSCPTGSIGAPSGARPPGGALPLEVTRGVWALGYTSGDSFGAMSWFVQRPQGNLLVDGPRWLPRLWDWIEARGGLAHVLLTHRDDVADAPRYAAQAGARLWIHEADRRAAPTATDRFVEEVGVAAGVRAIPAPGHTRGSACYLVDPGLLFTGDSLFWSRRQHDLSAFPGATWHSWEEQTASLARLAESARFAWVLPGHGGWGRDEPDGMRERLRALVGRMRAGVVPDGW